MIWWIVLGIYLAGAVGWCALSLSGWKQNEGQALSILPNLLGCVLAPVWPIVVPVLLFGLVADFFTGPK